MTIVQMITIRSNETRGIDPSKSTPTIDETNNATTTAPATQELNQPTDATSSITLAMQVINNVITTVYSNTPAIQGLNNPSTSTDATLHNQISRHTANTLSMSLPSDNQQSSRQHWAHMWSLRRTFQKLVQQVSNQECGAHTNRDQHAIAQPITGNQSHNRALARTSSALSAPSKHPKITLRNLFQVTLAFLLPGIGSAQLCEQVDSVSCAAAQGCAWQYLNNECDFDTNYCSYTSSYQCNARPHCVWDPAYETCRKSSTPHYGLPTYDTVGVEGSYIALGVDLGDFSNIAVQDIERATSLSIGAVDVIASFSGRDCGYAPLCGQAEELITTPTLMEILAQGGASFSSKTSIPCCAKRDTRTISSCQRLPPPGIETCRSHSLAKPLCDNVSPDKPDFQQCGNLLRDGHLTISVARVDPGIGSRCCKMCSCFGQFTCVGFDVQKTDTWELCNSHDLTTCLPSAQVCEGLRDHQGDFCEWSSEGSNPSYDSAISGNPCRRSSSAPEKWMLMIQKGIFKIELRQHRAGHISKARVTTSKGDVFVLDPLQCLAGRPWSSRVPTSWSYSKFEAFQAHVFIRDDESGVQASLLCVKNSVQSGQGFARINVEEVITRDGSGSSGGETSTTSMLPGVSNANDVVGGFCYTGSISERSPLFRPRDIRCHLPNGYQDPIDYFCGQGADEQNCRDTFCDKYWFPHYQTKGECMNEIGGKGYLLGVCKAFTGNNAAQTVNYLQCMKHVESYGWESMHNHFGTKFEDGETNSCVHDADDLPTKLNTCEDGLLIQYKSAGVVEEWITFRVIPASVRICGIGLLFDAKRHFQMFTRQIRVTQCSLPGKCLNANTCRSESGFKVDFTVEVIPPPTNTPTQFPTHFPTLSPSQFPTISNPDTGTNDNICPKNQIEVQCVDKCQLPCGYDPRQGKPADCGNPNCEPGCQCPPDFPWLHEPSGECYKSAALCPLDSNAIATVVNESPSNSLALETQSSISCPNNMEFMTGLEICPQVCGGTEGSKGRCLALYPGDTLVDGCGCPTSLPWFNPLTRTCHASEAGCPLSTTLGDTIPQPSSEDFECPENLVYDQCGSYCQQLCVGDYPFDTCIAGCNPGCHCPNHLPIFDAATSRCVASQDECKEEDDNTISCPGSTEFTTCGDFCPEVCQLINVDIDRSYCQPHCTTGCACPKEKPWVDLNTFECLESRSKCPRGSTYSPFTGVDDTGSCPGDLEFRGCGSFCPKECGKPDTQVCIAGCVAGCHCPDSRPWREPGTNNCHEVCPGDIGGVSEEPGVTVQFLALMKTPKAAERLAGRSIAMHNYFIRLLDRFLGEKLNKPEKFIGVQDLYLEKASHVAIIDIQNIGFAEGFHDSIETKRRICDFLSSKLAPNKICADKLLSVSQVMPSKSQGILVLVSVYVVATEERHAMVVELSGRAMARDLQYFLERLGGSLVYQSSGQSVNALVAVAIAGIAVSTLVVYGSVRHVRRRGLLRKSSSSTTPWSSTDLVDDNGGRLAIVVSKTPPSA